MVQIRSWYLLALFLFGFSVAIAGAPGEDFRPSCTRVVMQLQADDAAATGNSWAQDTIGDLAYAPKQKRRKKRH